MEINPTEVAKVFAAAKLTPTFHFADIHDNDTVNFCPNATPSSKNEGLPAPSRLSLFIRDRQQLKDFISDLSVCTSTRDVCLAIKNLCDGKIKKEFTDQDFIAALMPHLKFETSTDAVYQAIYRLT